MGNTLDTELRALLRAGRALEQMIRLWRIHGRNLPPAAIQQSYDLWLRFCVATHEMEDLFTPKRHLVAHLLGKLGLLGNPQQYANWLDESLNKDLKRSCRIVSQSTFERFLLLRMRELLRRSSLKRKAPD